MSGVGSSNVTDGGTSARVFGTLLSWLQEKTQLIYTVATCLHKDTLVSYADGSLLPISTLQKNYNNVNICTGNITTAMEIPSKFITRISNNNVEVISSFAHTKCTSDEKFFVFKNDKLVEIEASDLSSGDMIAAPIDEIKHSYNNTFTSKDECYLVGYTTGDGGKATAKTCIAPNRLQWAESDTEMISILKQRIEKVSGITPRITKRKLAKGHLIYIDNSAFVRRFIEKYPESVLPSTTRSVPLSIMTADNDSIGTFIRGLFDADGSAMVKNVSYSTVSRVLAHQIVILLRRLGIFGTLCCKKKKPNMAWTITICGQQLENFRRSIGFDMPRKQQQLDTLIATYHPEKYGVAADSVPIPWSTIYKLGHINRYWGTNRKLRMSRSHFVEILQNLRDNNIDTSAAEWVLSYNWDRVKTVNQCEPFVVYDLTMPKTHTFVANGLLVHNCNDVSKLPPEMLRKGRFDEIFWVDLPGPSAVKDILTIHLKKRGKDPKKFDLEKLSKITYSPKDGKDSETYRYSGSEWEEAINDAMVTAFDEDKPVTTAHIEESIKHSIPLGFLKKEEMRQAAEKWQSRARQASSETFAKEKLAAEDILVDALPREVEKVNPLDAI